MKPLDVYADTSVFGGAYDDEFKEASLAFFDRVRNGSFRLVVSDVSRQEVALAPPHVRELFEEMAAYMRLVAVDEEILLLRDAYVDAGIVRSKWVDDAGHVAAATVAGADLIVSWNFKHIVHFERIRQYNAVNALHGYRAIEIRSPLEVIDYEE